MSKLKKIAYDCRKATLLIEKRQMGKLMLQERAELAIHLAGCSVCRLYQQQSIAINGMIKKLFSSKSAQSRLDANFKDSLQQQINNHLR
jgi:hypothetical protein